MSLLFKYESRKLVYNFSHYISAQKSHFSSATDSFITKTCNHYEEIKPSFAQAFLSNVLIKHQSNDSKYNSPHFLHSSPQETDRFLLASIKSRWWMLESRTGTGWSCFFILFFLRRRLSITHRKNVSRWKPSFSIISLWWTAKRLYKIIQLTW